MRLRRMSLVLPLAVVVLVAVNPTPAAGANFTVTKTADTADGACNADCSLREAIIAANAALGPDTITVPAGTYTLTRTGTLEDAAATGDLDLSGELSINGAGASATIIQACDSGGGPCAGIDRVLQVNSGATISISGVTIRNGSATYADGGGILNYNNGNLTVTNSTVSGNSADGQGGGISMNGGMLTLTNSTVSGNSASLGGGIYVYYSTVAITSSTVSDNTAIFYGGGINNFGGIVTITSSTVSRNTAGQFGGGIVNNGSNGTATLNLTDSAVIGNSVGGLSGAHLGGGIFNTGDTGLGADRLGTVNITRSTVSGNTVTDALGGGGGGIANWAGIGCAIGGSETNGTLTLTNSTVSGNTADGEGSYGGGILNSYCFSLAATNSTVSGNSAAYQGGGIYQDAPARPATVKNTIVANSPSGGNCHINGDSFTSQGHNLSSDNTCASKFTSPGDLNSTDPGLWPLADNGGPTQTHGLLAGSPAIDAGDSNGCPATDQRGAPRPLGVGCDIGAVEGETQPPDSDGDGLLDPDDNCPLAPNAGQEDTDGDGAGDVCDAVTVAAGRSHTCVVTAMGAVKCWGSNQFGQLGDGTTTDRKTPVTVTGLSSGIAAVVAGRWYTCALTTGGGLKCWGSAYYAQLGDGTYGDESCICRKTPVDVMGLSSGVAAVAAGAAHTCALTTLGGVKCWGYNGSGQLGDGTTDDRTTPVDVTGLSSGVAAVAAAQEHTCAVTTGGSLKCWGYNEFGQLGDGTSGFGNNSTTPVDVFGLSSGVAAVAAGYGHTCAVTTGGSLKCWGANVAGGLGDGTTTDRTTPVADTGLSSGVAAVAAGDWHTCALTTGGGLKCWGNNFYGQLGDGTHGDPSCVCRAAPVNVVGFQAAPDGDTDGVSDASDNCPQVANHDQRNSDNDAQGDACDPDDDNDGVLDGSDNCPAAANPSQTNSDGDSYGDACDNCPQVANPNQANSDNDTLGDACDPDDDNDSVADGSDNCPLAPNADQIDNDRDGLGDACDATSGALGYYHPVTPYRILDTRSGPQGSPAGKVRSNAEITVDVTGGASGVPATGVSAVVLNTTVTEPSASSYLTVYPSGVARPLASNLNFSAGQTVPNLVTVKVSGDGHVNVYNAVGQTHVIFDVVGWYGAETGGSRFNALAPVRILDTRNATGFGGGKVSPNATITVDVTGTLLSGVPATGVSAVVVNATVTDPTAGSYLTVYPSDALSRPTASNLNFVAGQTVPNLVTVKVGADGNVKIYNAVGSTHVIFDVVGWYGVSGDLFHPLTPCRSLDTRPSALPGPKGKVASNAEITVDVTGVCAVPNSGATGVIVNTTVTEPTSGSYLTVYPSGVTRPTASNLNFLNGQTVPNLVIVKVGGDGNVRAYNAVGQTHVIFDTVGYFGQ